MLTTLLFSRRFSFGSFQMNESNCPDLTLIARGKVRDIYSIPGEDDKLLFVASDRLSAFDVILENVRPAQQIVSLVQLSLSSLSFLRPKLTSSCLLFMTFLLLPISQLDRLSPPKENSSPPSPCSGSPNSLPSSPTTSSSLRQPSPTSTLSPNPFRSTRTSSREGP